MCAKLDTTGLLADVTYAILHDDLDAGHEQGRLYCRADGGYWMTSDLEVMLPVPFTLYVETRAKADWRAESLDVRLFSSGVHRDASYHAVGDVWRGTLETDEATTERSVPVGPEAQVEFDSTWSATLVLNRLTLAPGQARDVDVVRVAPPSLEPMLEHRRYEYLGLEHLATPAGEWKAAHHVSGVRHLWADTRGIVVAAQYTINGLRYDARLIKYHWLGQDAQVDS